MIKIIGGGLAGVEVANFLANRKIPVTIYEMRPTKYTEVHQTDLLGELVCSNSLRSNDINTAVGLLKEEMRLFDSLILKAAEVSKIEGGTSLMVDRVKFSNFITNSIKNNPYIKIINEEVTNLNLDELTVIATGPLTSKGLVDELLKLNDSDTLNFFDAVAPIIEFDSINLDICYFKDRYSDDGGTYLNCPMTKEEYDTFYSELINAERHAPKDFEKEIFEACMPIEVMAERGYQTPLFGPLKPVGLEVGNNRPYAVVQLRPDDFSRKMYNMVGFQTSLKHPEQTRIIRLIPGLENANILRYGVIHRNTYLNSPKILTRGFQFKDYPNLFLVGQISGVEGYVESAASGIAAAINIYNQIVNKEPLYLPEETMMGSLDKYVSSYNSNFVPMNANFGIIKEINKKMKRKEKRAMYGKVSIEALNKFRKENPWI